MASKNLTLTLTIDKSTNKVVFAEADKDFIDILLSFLTLPLGTILKRTNVSIPRCLSNLKKGVDDLNEDYLKVHKERLLKPSYETELECLDLAVNPEYERTITYYSCGSTDLCRDVLSPYNYRRCICGSTMYYNIQVARETRKKEKNEGVFLKGLMRFLITDDFVIAPASTQAVLMLLDSLGDNQKTKLEKRNVLVGDTEVRSLLYESMITESAFTNVFLKKESAFAGRVEIQKMAASLILKPLTNSSSEPSDNHVSINLIIDKHEKKVMYADCDHSFVDLLFNLLTYPSGYVVKNLNGRSHITCFDNLYASAVSPAMAVHFKNHQSKEYIINPKLHPSFSILKTDTGSIKFQDGLIPDQPNITGKRMKIMDDTDVKGFVYETTYIVTDDLVVTTSISSVAHLIANAKEGVEEVAVNVGNNEVFLLLEAALGSKTALTNAFMKFTN